jgi:DNA-directed RNA polymerase specialized sigma24 family protein
VVNQDAHTRTSPNPRATRLADPKLAAGLRRFVRSRAPESDVEDIVQSTLADALASHTAPDGNELQPWLYGIARNKIADLFRRARREAGREPLPSEEVAAADSAPASARDLLRWAEKELPSGESAESTLEWMLREGEGEKLESIAAEENVPAPRVRQRVARLRKHFRARWAAQLAAVAVLVAVAALLLARLLRKDDIARPEPPRPAPSVIVPPEPSPEERAAQLRRGAFEACDARDWYACKWKLDQAKELDPAGDTAPDVVKARRAATDAMRLPLDSNGAMDKSSGPALPSSSAPAPSGFGTPSSAKPPTTSLLSPDSTSLPEAPKPDLTSQTAKPPPPAPTGAPVLLGRGTTPAPVPAPTTKDLSK